MAYGNWTGEVFLEGKRRIDKEDVGVWDTDESNIPKRLRIFANILKNQEIVDDTWDKHSHHAVLGDGLVRLCGYKDGAELWVWDEENKKGHRVLIWDFIFDKETEFGFFHESKYGNIMLNGERWYYEIIKLRNPNGVELKLQEPDGWSWIGRSYYQY